MLSDYGFRIKTWKLGDEEKRDKWIEKHKSNFQIRTVFVNNKLAVEYKRLIKL